MPDQNLILARPVRFPFTRVVGYRVISLLLGLIAVFLLGEAILRIVLPSQERFYMWPPNMRVTLQPNPELLPGVSGTAHFYTNSLGIRGDEVAKEQKYRILAVGGSTTECLYLDDTETWTYILQQKLSDAKQVPIWVGNIGRSGRNTRDHILQLKYLLPEYPKIDAAILLVGVNDLHLKISDQKYDPELTLKATFETAYKPRAFSIVPSEKPAYHYTRLGWWRVAKKFKNVYLDKVSDLPYMDLSGGSFVSWRRYRQNAKEIIHDVPDLTIALAEYRRNLETIVDLLLARSVRPIFVTQPTIWRPDLTQEEIGLLWGGGIDSFQLGKGVKYYSPSSLEMVMRQYNDALLAVCRERAIDCIDLAGVFPKDRAVFYDDVHFTEAGARKVAEILFEHLGPQLPKH